MSQGWSLSGFMLKVVVVVVVFEEVSQCSQPPMGYLWTLKHESGYGSLIPFDTRHCTLRIHWLIVVVDYIYNMNDIRFKGSQVKRSGKLHCIGRQWRVKQSDGSIGITAIDSLRFLHEFTISIIPLTHLGHFTYSAHGNTKEPSLMNNVMGVILQGRKIWCWTSP